MNKVEEWASVVVYALVYVIVFVLNPGHRYAEIRTGALDHKKGVGVPVIPNGTNGSFVLEEARREVDREENRRAVIDNKSKVLLTVSAIMLAAIAALMPHLPMVWIALVPMGFVLVAVFLTLMYFRTYRTMVVDPLEIDWANSSLAMRELARIEFECAAYMGPQNDFRVGMHRSARRALVIGVLALVPIPVTLALRPGEWGSEQSKADTQIHESVDTPHERMEPEGPAAREEEGDLQEPRY
jgi:hypothetical protein